MRIWLNSTTFDVRRSISFHPRPKSSVLCHFRCENFLSQKLLTCFVRIYIFFLEGETAQKNFLRILIDSSTTSILMLNRKTRGELKLVCTPPKSNFIGRLERVATWTINYLTNNKAYRVLRFKCYYLLSIPVYNQYLALCGKKNTISIYVPYTYFWNESIY